MDDAPIWYPDPGWHPDPHDPSRNIFWDGSTWQRGARSSPPMAEPPPLPPASPPGKQRNAFAVAGLMFLVLCLGVGCMTMLASRNSHDATSSSTAPGTATSSGCGDVGPTCDATPKVDGKYKVSGGGVLDTGIGAGWIATAGKRSGQGSCQWERLSGPVPHQLQMIIDAGRTESANSPIYVHIETGDSYFWSEGCQPWVRVDHK